MKYLKRFEEVDLDKYKNFLNKYQKSGYISISSVKKLKEWGLDIRDFSHVENQVINSLDFFRAGDRDLFLDYFLEIKDKYPDISSYFYYSLDVFPKGSKDRYSRDLDKFNFVVSMNEQNLPSFDGLNIDNNISVIDKVISGIEKSKKDIYKKGKDLMDNKTSFFDIYFAKSYLRSGSLNQIENCKISPVISIKIFLHTDDDDAWMNHMDDYENYNKFIKEKRKEAVNDIELDLDRIFKSYFYSIGYPNINYKIEKRGYGWEGFYDDGDIITFNICCELNN
jgi:hypothetical protein